MTDHSQTMSKNREDMMKSDLEVSSKSVVKVSAKQFTQSLTETPQYRKFSKSYQKFMEDDDAQEIYNALRQKQESLRMMMMLNAVDEADQVELENLEKKFYDNALVKRYLAAQEELLATCQQVGDVLSEAVGLDFGTSCRVGGCCG